MRAVRSVGGRRIVASRRLILRTWVSFSTAARASSSFSYFLAAIERDAMNERLGNTSVKLFFAPADAEKRCGARDAQSARAIDGSGSTVEVRGEV